MDHVLIDMETRRMIGRGLYGEVLKAQETLGEQFRYHVVYCNEAKGFAVYPHEILTDLWLKAKGFQHAPLVQYSMLCKAMHDESQKVGPISVALATLTREEDEMSNVAEQNGVKWPQRGASARVFEIAQAISTQKKDFATKDEVVAAATAEGINAGTAGTQYSAWLRYWQGPVNEAPAAPVAPVQPQAPAAPVAPVPPQHQMPVAPQQTTAPAVVQAVQEAVQHAAPVAPAQTWTPPAAPAFSQQPHAPSQPFAQPAAAQEIAVQGNRNIEPEQRASVEVGVHASVSLAPAISKLEKLLEVLKDAQADFGG
jgi:hypothetical protein